MENLLKPDIGLMFWTVLTFLGMVFILGRFAWGPLLKSLEERDARIRKEVETAEQNRISAEKFKEEYQQALAKIESKAQEIVSQAKKDGEKAYKDMIQSAQDEVRELVEKNKDRLNEEQKRLIQEMRQQVAEMTVHATEKLLQTHLQGNMRERFMETALKEIEKATQETSSGEKN